jgi:hypothetical protein
MMSYINKYHIMSSTKVLGSAAIETYVRNEISIAVHIQVTDFLVVMPCSLTGGCQHSGGTMKKEAA